jgi:hypothetical protein
MSGVATIRVFFAVKSGHVAIHEASLRAFSMPGTV